MAVDLAVRHIDVGIVTNDRDAALRFWSGVLGFPVETETRFPHMTVIRLRAGDALIRLCMPDSPATREADRGAFGAETGLRYLTLTVYGLDALVAEVSAGGYPVTVSPCEIRPGQRFAQIQDGQGITIDLMEAAGAR